MGGRLQLVLMRHPPQLSIKTTGGGAVGGGVQPGIGGVLPGVGGGGQSLPGVGGGLAGGQGGVQLGVRGGGVRVRVRVRVTVTELVEPVLVL